MDNYIIELLIAGRIPGTSVYIHFEAFLEGLLIAMLAAVLTYRALQLTTKYSKSPEQRLRTVKV